MWTLVGECTKCSFLHRDGRTFTLTATHELTFTHLNRKPHFSSTVPQFHSPTPPGTVVAAGFNVWLLESAVRMGHVTAIRAGQSGPNHFHVFGVTVTMTGSPGSVCGEDRKRDH